MASRAIPEHIQRRLYAESMGRCMNPSCKKELFTENGDIIEKAHIDPYCKTADHSFENLIVLCPNCHTDFDKNNAFSPEEILSWKKLRQQEQKEFFQVKYKSFDELRQKVVPLLNENKMIYEQYYLRDKKERWDACEIKILANNQALRELLSNNMDLIQVHKDASYSNRAIIQRFLLHIDEFESTRQDTEKARAVLFPKEINSIFGIEAVDDSIMPSVEAFETLLEALDKDDKLKEIELGVNKPYFQIVEDGKTKNVFISDTPRMRQLYHNYKSFRKTGVRLESLLFALRYISNNNVRFSYIEKNNLRKIQIGGKVMVFVYEYCLSQAFLRELAPPEGEIIVNLHNWNGESCISKEAYTEAERLGVQLLTMENFYAFIRHQKKI